MNASNYLGIISSSEIEQLRNARKKGLAHPVAALALAVDASQVAITTEQAGKAILRMNEDWLSSLKQRLLDTTDFSNASGALGEIRAYGALLETGMTVIPKPSVPGKKVIPEFEVDARDGGVIMEVQSRQLDNAQTQAAEGHHQKMIAKHQSVAVKVTVPFRSLIGSSPDYTLFQGKSECLLPSFSGHSVCLTYAVGGAGDVTMKQFAGFVPHCQGGGG